MSKKKAFSGSTMTLKDFHGGSIPSDLPLPSAPGTVVKVPERERQNAGSTWGGSGNRGYSAGGRQGFGNNPQRGFEEKVSYLPNSANIGRNFDEDERKPLDSFPRRGGGEEDYQEERRYRTVDRVGSARSEVKSESSGLGIARQQQQYSASSQQDLGLVSNQDRGFNQGLFGNQVLAPLPKQSGSGRSVQQFGPAPAPASAPAPAAVPNAWGIRRETEPSGVNETFSSSSLCAESVASRFAQASAVDKVSSGRWQSRLSLGLEQQSDRFGQTQHLDSLYDGWKAGLDSGSLGYGGAESDSMGRWTRTQVSTEQNSYDERERNDVDDIRRNSYVDSRKRLSVDLGKTDAAKDFLIEPARNSAVDKLSVYAETAKASFGELAQARLGSNVENCGNADASFNRTEVRADISRSEMVTLGNTVSRQLSPVMDLTESKNGSSHLKERVALVENSFEVSGPYYNTRSAQSLGNSRDSLISEGSKSTFYSDYKVSGNVVQSLDNEASRNRFGAEDARLSSPHGGNRPLSTESNLSPAIGSSVHVRSDSSVRPRLNLLPRTKPLEFASETAASEHLENSLSGLTSKSYEYYSASSPLPVEATSEAGNAIYSAGKALGTSEIEEENRRTGRPKLNLKPRTLPVEQLDANLEKERKSLFGGARPRELVLKERGVDDTVIHGLDPVPVDNIGKGSKMASKGTNQLDEKVEQNVDSSGVGRNIRLDDKAENIVSDRKVNGPPARLDTSRSERRDLDKKDHRADMEKQELQRNIRRNENWRNPHNNYKQERRQDPDKQDSWRKPADHPSSNSGLQKNLSSSLVDSSTNVPGKYGHGRATSAVELAQAFSKSASLIVNGQRSPLTNPSLNDSSGRKALPFSRLTDSSVPREFYSSSAQRHINGY